MARALAEQVAPGESAGTATAASERTARLPETSSVFVQVSTRVQSPSAAQHSHIINIIVCIKHNIVVIVSFAYFIVYNNPFGIIIGVCGVQIKSSLSIVSIFFSSLFLFNIFIISFHSFNYLRLSNTQMNSAR